ncbi:MAG: Holliday junction branch migration protein RuvA [Flavobacteriaceae bacterium]
MINHLRGKLVEKNPTYAVIECNGVGYFVNISLQTFGALGDQEAVFLYTHMIVREDAHTLFGFKTVLEREIFRLLISVSGVGPSTARTMLSSMSPEEIQQGIVGADVALIQSVKGIGAKTAQRVILDLKDKIMKTYQLDEVVPQREISSKEEAISALEVLGFTRKQCEKVINGLLKIDPQLSVEELIKKALKSL